MLFSISCNEQNKYYFVSQLIDRLNLELKSHFPAQFQTYTCRKVSIMYQYLDPTCN